MQRSAMGAIGAVMLSVVLLAGCADQEPPCDTAQVQWDPEAQMYRCPDGTAVYVDDNDQGHIKIKIKKSENKSKSATGSKGKR